MIGLLVRALVALLATATMIGLADVALLSGSADAIARVVLALTTTAVQVLVGVPLALGLTALVALARRSPTLGRRQVLAGIAGLSGLGLAPINATLLGARPVVGVAFVGLTALLAGLAFGLRAGPKWRRATAGLALVVAVVALVVNARAFIGTNAPQHFTLVLVAWLTALPAGFVVLAPVEAEVRSATPARGHVLLALLLVASVGLVARSSALATADIELRTLLRSRTSASRATFEYLDPLLDFDGDGFTAGFGGGDCRPFDASAHPDGREIAGDGKDQNCFAGDPSEAEVATFDAAIAGRGHQPPTRRILLLTVDALRHDAALPLTAERLGDRCRHYPMAYALSPSTTYSVHGLMTSRYPSLGRYRKLGRWNVPVDDPAPRVAALLGAAGYATAAFAFHHRFDPRLGLTVGFDQVWTAEARPEIIQGLAAPSTNAEASAWLAQRGPDERWFLWVHYYDPHAPYLRHRPATTSGATSNRDNYDDEVAFTDVHVDAFLAEIPRLEEVAIILTADHGEAFGEHGAVRHSSDLFDEQIRVPLWICPPAGHAPAPPRSPVSALDVAPTLLDFATLAAPETFHGRSMLVADDRPAFAETAGEATPMQAVIYDDHKLIRVPRGGLWLLFDLRDDPGETRDLARDEPARLAKLQAWLDRWVAWLTATP